LHSSEEMQDKESRLQAIINTAVDGIMTINNRGIVETMNPAAAALFGYNPEEVIGNNISMLMPDPDKSRHDSYLTNYQETGHRKIIGIGREVMALRKNGTTFPIHLSVSQVILNNRIIFTGILHDLSAQKAAEEKVRRYAKELERSNSELQDFAYVSSHDLQEPLRKIRAFGDRLKREVNQLNDKSIDYLERMINAAERMQDLINDLLSFSRVSTHAKAFQQLDLNQIAAEVLSDLEVAIENSNAVIEIGKLPTIEGESIQIRQLFQNLISNAIKFRRDGVAPHIKIHSEIIEQVSYPGSKLNSEENIKIYFQDNGIGFDDKYKDKIFQIFQRLEGRKYEGSGIGLAICKRIATRHGGDIEAFSTLNEGATFVITLPLNQNQSIQNL
jgi:two-component system sensor kinase FixL